MNESEAGNDLVLAQKQPCFSYVCDIVLMLISKNLNQKSEVIWLIAGDLNLLRRPSLDSENNLFGCMEYFFKQNISFLAYFAHFCCESAGSL